MVLKSSPSNFYLLLLYVLCNKKQKATIVIQINAWFIVRNVSYSSATLSTWSKHAKRFVIKFYTTYMVATITADNKGDSSVAYKPIGRSLQELSHSLHHPGQRDIIVPMPCTSLIVML